MLLDQYGQPIGHASFLVPEFVVRETASAYERFEVERRVRELRHSIAFADRFAREDTPLRRGDTISIRLPRRFA